MSFAFVGMMTLLGSAVVTAFILHPAKEEAAISANSNQRCPEESLQSIRKRLLGALSLQTEPQLPAGFLDGVREQWQRTFRTISQSAKDTAAFDASATPESGNSTGLKCCSTASEVSMKDLGWDSWVIHPLSLTIVRCALCNYMENTVQCPSSSSIQDSQDDLPCCQPASQDMVSIVYMDETDAVVISSVQLTRSCGCGPGNTEQQGKK
ncbi:gonadal somatic cell derived factor [Kryptolebias marmoratus]|uniref:Growth/differentiation factor 7-like n=1 Tax=Kryptolebias marmoratus TaxID=37003 RepID=A0A3Q3AMM6_KRYMA|nr:gonadal somatic cell derived factor [Kryptolebias marmoratus]